MMERSMASTSINALRKTGSLRKTGPRGTTHVGRSLIAGVVCACLLAGCAETITKHGHQFRDTDIQQITPGMSQEQVKLTLGTPTTTSAVATGNAFYYIASTEAEKSFLSPRETDRQVVAIYFNQGGSVDQVANYGLKDGKVFDYITAKTPAPGSRDEGLLKSLFRNLGSKQLYGN
jgi:outer membrane protein assembly factor BamE (lipoprotein component of BamABCDE complex)